MADPYAGHERKKSDPSRRQAHAFIANVGVDIDLTVAGDVAKALYVGGVGDLYVVHADDDDATVSQYMNFQGTLRGSVRIIKAATTATAIQPMGE